MIVDENNIFEYIKNYPFLDIEAKNSILKYFDKLNKNQISWLIDYFNNEKKDILNFLRNLKNKELIKFEEIKTQIDNFWRNKLKLEELIENEKENDEILDLINNINNI